MKNDVQKLTITDKIEPILDDADDIIGPTTANQKCETIVEEHVTIEEYPPTLSTTALFNT